MNRCICMKSQVSMHSLQDIGEQEMLTLRTDWVLYDPNKGIPSRFPYLPKIMRPYAHYKPGNNRVLEFNLVSESVRLKRTPTILRDCIWNDHSATTMYTASSVTENVPVDGGPQL